MVLIDTEKENGNWWEVLAVWSRISNWQHYRATELELNNQLKSLLCFLWNEKDWLKKQYPKRGKEIESFIDGSTYLKVVADLANTIKHRKGKASRRSTVEQTDFFGRIKINDRNERKLHFFNTDGKMMEIMEILRGAIEEFEQLKGNLVCAGSNNSSDPDSKFAGG